MIMSYDTLEKQIRMLPEECLDDVSHYIEFIIYRLRLRDKERQASDLTEFYGVLNQMPDGLKMQRELRDEWD